MPVASLVAALLGMGAGALSGRALAARGVTAANALEGRGPLAAGIIALAALGAAFLYFPSRIPAIPLEAQLSGQYLSVTLTIFAAAFSVGLLVRMEWRGRLDPERRRRLGFGASVLGVLLGVLLWRSMPIDGALGPALVYEDVVMQTTGFTCAPAAIATLARWAGVDTAATERQVVALSRTDRWGTNTVMEMRALEALGLTPVFENGLEADDLVRHGGLALLHVNEPVGPRRIRHAVALLSVDAASGRVVIGNPLEGQQEMSFAELEDGYWNGEAVLIAPAAAGGG